MARLIISLLVIFGLIISYGCPQAKAEWPFKFGRPKEEKTGPQKVKGTLLASVNGKVITLEDFKQRIEAYNNEIKASPDIPDKVKSNYLIKTFADKKRLLDEMVKTKLLIVEATDRGMDKDKDYQETINALSEQLLLSKIIEREKAKVKVTTTEIENFYNANKVAFTIPEERRVGMMVLPSEDKAKEMLIALLQGQDFSALARKNSTDESKNTGGDIGFIVRKTPFPQADKKMMFKKLEEVAFSLELNKPSTIFKGPAGFYIIKVSEIKDARQRLLSEVYQDIEQGLLFKKQDDALKTLIGNLRKASNVIVHEKLLR